MNIRCPFCKEPLEISEEESGLPLDCPMCGKTFIWAQEVQAHRDKKLARKELRKLAREEKKAKLRKLEEERIRKAAEREAQEYKLREEKKTWEQELKEQKKQKLEQERIKASRIKYQCEVCGKGFGDIDIPSRARKENGKVYCHKHIPKTHPCPDCGKEVSKKAPTCPHCGRPLTNSNAHNEFLARSGGSHMAPRRGRDRMFCPYCKERIRADALKCKHCGQPLGKMRRHEKVEKAALFGGLGLIIAILIAILVGIIMVLLLV